MAQDPDLLTPNLARMIELAARLGRPLTILIVDAANLGNVGLSKSGARTRT
jgi:hypothetical protein